MSLRKQLIMAMIIVLLVSAGISLIMLYNAVLRPGAEQMAEQIASQVILMKSLSNKNLAAGIMQQPVDASSLPDLPFYQLFKKSLRQILGQNNKLLYSRQHQLLWIQVNNSEWYSVKFSDLSATGIQWLILSFLISFLVAMIIGWLLARYISRPLRDISTLTAQFRQRGKPPAMADTGPKELRLLRQMMQNAAHESHQISSDRKLMMVAISHDLRTPMMRLRFGAEMLDNSDLKDGIIDDLSEMDEIVDGFITLVKNSANEEISGVDLIDVLQTLEKRQQRCNQPIKFTSDTQICIIQAQRLSIERLFENLINNAYKHGIPPVDISLQQKPGWVWVTVRDHGKGVDPAELKSLCQPFYKADSARGVAGAGLGLAIVKKIINDQRGQLNFSVTTTGGLQVQVGFPFA